MLCKQIAAAKVSISNQWSPSCSQGQVESIIVCLLAMLCTRRACRISEATQSLTAFCCDTRRCEVRMCSLTQSACVWTHPAKKAAKTAPYTRIHLQFPKVIFPSQVTTDSLSYMSTMLVIALLPKDIYSPFKHSCAVYAARQVCLTTGRSSSRELKVRLRLRALNGCCPLQLTGGISACSACST